ncbi:hypothetical protein CIY_12290 [Butyrivibrio fibrisolvens 16/4]|nr:hypothetical protein CIY_12290 [Butyrivibrio fibrisolvens 16/4]
MDNANAASTVTIADTFIEDVELELQDVNVNIEGSVTIRGNSKGVELISDNVIELKNSATLAIVGNSYISVSKFRGSGSIAAYKYATLDPTITTTIEDTIFDNVSFRTQDANVNIQGVV